MLFHVRSPEPESGKTRLLEVLALLTRKAWHAVQPSEAVLYRMIDQNEPTLLLDETDAQLGNPKDPAAHRLRGLLDAGNRRGVTVPRCVGDGHDVDHFKVFCPKAFAGLGSLPHTIASRSIPVDLRRRTPSEPVERFRPRDVERQVAPLVAALRRAYRLGQEKLGLTTSLTFPHFAEGRRGSYLTEAQCQAICAHFQARSGAAVKADVFRLAYLTGVRKGQLRRTTKRHVHIQGDIWKLVWPKEDTKNGRAHALVLAGEERAIVERAWAARRPDSDYLFHVNGRPIGPMRSELARTCALLSIPYGRSRGVVFHDTRHSAITNLVASGTGEAAAMSITGHADPSIFKRYNVRRDSVQEDAAARRDAYLASQLADPSTAAPSAAVPLGRGARRPRR